MPINDPDTRALQSLAAKAAPGRRFIDHPDREMAQAEIHARPISRIQAPARIRRIAFLLGQNLHDIVAVRSRLVAYCLAAGVAPPAERDRRFSFAAAPHEVTWEFHTEFYTATWISPFDNADHWPTGIGLEAVGNEGVAVAVRVDVMASETITSAALAGFDELSLCYSDIEGGRAQLATDFVADHHGYTRYEMAAGTVGPYNLGAIVRRVLEIETYRVMSLIGITLARHVSPQLSRLEARLTEAMQAIGSSASAAESHVLLETMHDLQVAAAHTVELTRYRFGACQAYGDILGQRLKNLDERPNGEHRTLARYLNHRVDPALATFKAIQQRQTALFDQMARSTALLGTRISLDIQTQNRHILETISNTAQSQFRLQRTVEGLSTIAISYYILGIVGYAFHVFDHSYEYEKTIAIALLAPLIVALVWLRMRRIHKH
ncbi:DUF3422 domain-containing protein [Lichenifustis flavocetrariae]|uniref:DUF3422 domain-containing protein n=1 Tax=Lichenifustis flavocetrariae TaxID=2949735 RepID=A0AA41YYT0_9HYPH|nr:DUF3422 domain-containing protein [Lichenifustis flavocetrariae]MCW6507315.1 DUF3422 domain-containing protein [Lichenifustis flavocetrariae]